MSPATPRDQFENLPSWADRYPWNLVAPLLLVTILLSSAPALAGQCGMGNSCPILDSLSMNPGILAPGQQGLVSATAHDPDGQITRYDFTATAGTFPNGTQAETIYTSATAQTIAWTAPSAPGTYSITCRVWDNGGWMHVPSSGNVSVKTVPIEVSIANLAPVIDDLHADRTQLYLSETAALTATAHDPDGDPITYAWTASMGTVTPGAAGSATYQAPTYPGVATVTLMVTDDKGASSSSALSLFVTDAMPSKEISDGLATPLRMAMDSYGYLYVADQRAGGIVVESLSTGYRHKMIPAPDVTGVSIDSQDRILVGGVFGARLLDRDGAFLQGFTPDEPLGSVTDVAVDAAGRRYAVLYGSAGRVVVFDASGNSVLSFGTIGDGPGELKQGTALAVDSLGRFYVGDSGHGKIQLYDASGGFLQSFGARGSDPGEVNQLDGLFVSSQELLYATDSYQSRVTVFKSDGTLHEIIGTYGDAVGQFKNSAGIFVDESYGHLIVASVNSSELEVFDLQGATTPPSNTAPTIPQPLSPLDGAALPPGTPLTLETQNAFDPDFQSLTYTFEIEKLVAGSWQLQESRQTAEQTPTTAVDCALLLVTGSYRWRVQAFDGMAASGWSTTQAFGVIGSTNSPPSAPVPMSPTTGLVVTDLTPALQVINATDPDGDPLSYQFEVVLPAGAAYTSAALSPQVPETAGSTIWQMPAGVLDQSQLVYWHARAFDGYRYGPWSGYAIFRTPPFAVPQSREVGYLPGGDASRPSEIRYRSGPLATDTTLYFQIYGITLPSQLLLEVNGTDNHPVPPAGPSAWSLTVSVTIPAAELHQASDNHFRFVYQGSLAYWGIRNVSIIAPPRPLLSAHPYNTVVDLTWVPDPSLPVGSTLRLYRAYFAQGPFTSIGDYPNGQGIVRDIGLVNDWTYFYRASYVDTAGNEGDPSPVVQATPSTANGPTPITDLRLVRSSDDLVLNWTPVTSSPSITQYEIYRDLFGNWTPDTSTFTNRYAITGPYEGAFTVPGGALGTSRDWFSVIPLDYDGARATP